MRYCGVDIGTTNTKAVILDEAGGLLDRVSLPVPPQLLRVPWYDHFCECLARFAAKGLLGKENVTVSITAQGGSFVFLDSKYQAVSPGFSWTQPGNEETAIDMAEVLGSRSYYQRTGWAPDSWLMACKAKELIQQRAEDLRYIATVPEFIHARLAGTFVSDLTNAQITGLFNFEAMDWDDDILTWAQIRREWLPAVSRKPEVIREDVPIAGGKIHLATSSHDQYAAMLGAHVDNSETLMLGTGTAWVVAGKSRSPISDPETFSIHPGRDTLPGWYGFISSLAAVGKGFEKTLEGLGVGFSELSDLEALFDRTDPPDGPIHDDLGFVRSETSEKVLTVRRAMEAIAGRLRRLLDSLPNEVKVGKIVMTGGAAQSRRWPEIIAQLCRLPVYVLEFSELGAYGAAMLARHALNKPAWPDRPKEMQITPHHPTPAESDRYENWYQTHQKSAF